MFKKILALSMFSVSLFGAAPAADYFSSHKPADRPYAELRDSIESKLGESSLDVYIQKILNGETVEKDAFYGSGVGKDDLGRTLLMRAAEVGGAALAEPVLDIAEDILSPHEMFCFAAWPDNNDKTILHYLVDAFQKEQYKIGQEGLRKVLIRVFRDVVKGCGGRLDISTRFYSECMSRNYDKSNIDMKDASERGDVVEFLTHKDHINNDSAISHAVRCNSIAAVKELVPLTLLVLKASDDYADWKIDDLTSEAFGIALKGKNYDMLNALARSFGEKFPMQNLQQAEDLRNKIQEMRTGNSYSKDTGILDLQRKLLKQLLEAVNSCPLLDVPFGEEIVKLELEIFPKMQGMWFQKVRGIDSELKVIESDLRKRGHWKKKEREQLETLKRKDGKTAEDYRKIADLMQDLE